MFYNCQESVKKLGPIPYIVASNRFAVLDYVTRLVHGVNNLKPRIIGSERFKYVRLCSKPYTL